MRTHHTCISMCIHANICKYIKNINIYVHVFEKYTLQIFRAISQKSFLNFYLSKGKGFCSLFLKRNFLRFLPDVLCHQHHSNT